MKSVGYQLFLERAAKMLSNVMHTDPLAATVHVLAENGQLPPDVFVKIAQCADQNPEKDIVIFIQRADFEAIKAVMMNGGAS